MASDTYLYLICNHHAFFDFVKFLSLDKIHHGGKMLQLYFDLYKRTLYLEYSDNFTLDRDEFYSEKNRVAVLFFKTAIHPNSSFTSSLLLKIIQA